MLLRDFNYEFIIYWSHNSIISTCQVANTFINTIHEHVHKPTRFSPGQSSHILNLIFANEENMLGLENSDHIILFVSTIILITNQSYVCETSVVEIMIFIKQCWLGPTDQTWNYIFYIDSLNIYAQLSAYPSFKAHWKSKNLYL